MINQKNAVVFLAFVVLLYAALLIGMLDFMFEDDVFAEFFRNLVLAVTSIIIGIPVGLALNRRWQREQDRCRRRELVISLRGLLVSNIILLRQMYHQMMVSLDSVPSISADVTTLEATSHFRHELLAGHLDLATAINIAQRDLLHVNGRIEMSQTRLFGGDDRLFPIDDERIENLLRQLESHIETFSLAAAARKHTQISKLEVDLLVMKLGTIKLIGGLVLVTEVTAGTESLTGGATAHCRTAIAAIDDYLKHHPA